MVVALTDVTDFRHRIRRTDVDCVALGKAPGHGAQLYPRLLRLLRQCRPAVVHTRNLGPLEMQVAAAVAGVPARIHGEHGRELDDLNGSNRKLRWLRRLYSPFVHRYVALSRDLERYLVESVGIRAGRIAQIYNGVDTDRFQPATGARAAVSGCPFPAGERWLLGTVGRMHGVKDPTLLARAFARALVLAPALRGQVGLVMVGDGPLRGECQAIVNHAGLAREAWLPGERSDVADIMRGLDCFVLPSLAEGISNTILEAMATGLPVVATSVGGNVELVEHERTGLIAPAADVDAMAHALIAMASDRARAAAWGRAGRAEVERRFSLRSMVASYRNLYDRQLAAAGRPGLHA
jgi:sugar transferase (PEP-CTERM/EpsH1 system associated)